MSAPRSVIGYHLILTCYGFWLPNDPRGSGSDAVWSEALKPFGPATKVRTQRSVAHVPHDQQLRRAAKRALKHPPIRFNGFRARAIANGVGQYIRTRDLHCHACAVMPDHAHFVLTRTHAPIERIAIGLKAASVHALLSDGLHHDQSSDADSRRKIWARGQRHVFLWEPFEVRRDIKYVEDNPVEWGLKRQSWTFVTPYAEPRTK